jgi:hypothetical protein
VIAAAGRPGQLGDLPGASMGGWSLGTTRGVRCTKQGRRLDSQVEDASSNGWINGCLLPEHPIISVALRLVDDDAGISQSIMCFLVWAQEGCVCHETVQPRGHGISLNGRRPQNSVWYYLVRV